MVKHNDNKILVVGLTIIAALVVVVFFQMLKVDSYSVTNKNEAVEQIDPDRLLIIKSDELAREYEGISTTIFNLYNEETSEVCSISDGEMDFDYICKTLEEFVNSNKYEVISLGIINNAFFIQQDTTNKVSSDIRISIVTLKEDFKSEDYFEMTESIYSKTEIQADSLFTHHKSSGSKHYIYAYLVDDTKLNTNSNENAFEDG